MIRNILFVVEGRTEGFAHAFGKGLQNILRDECQFMREKGIRFHTIPKNGKGDLLSNIGFDVRAHLNPPKKRKEKLGKQGSAKGDFVFILRDLDCGNEAKVKKEILDRIDPGFHRSVEIHFAVQEIESWFFADPEGFSNTYSSPPKSLISKMVKRVPKNRSPEDAIGCDPMPSKVLEDLADACKLSYRKTIEGPQALLKVDPQKVANRCPHFCAFQTSLRQKINYGS